jgi:hypothetical protein
MDHTPDFDVLSCQFSSLDMVAQSSQVLESPGLGLITSNASLPAGVTTIKDMILSILTPDMTYLANLLASSDKIYFAGDLTVKTGIGMTCLLDRPGLTTFGYPSQLIDEGTHYVSSSIEADGAINLYLSGWIIGLKDYV